MKLDQSKHYREICNLTYGQLECIVASEHAPDEVWLAVAFIGDWLADRADGQHNYRVKKEVEQIARARTEPRKTRATHGNYLDISKRDLHRLEQEVTCVLVTE